jgi:hypothetical protein
MYLDSGMGRPSLKSRGKYKAMLLMGRAMTPLLGKVLPEFEGFLSGAQK